MFVNIGCVIAAGPKTGLNYAPKLCLVFKPSSISQYNCTSMFVNIRHFTAEGLKTGLNHAP